MQADSNTKPSTNAKFIDAIPPTPFAFVTFVRVLVVVAVLVKKDDVVVVAVVVGACSGSITAGEFG